ncbi:hypothetical protein MZO23_015350, partial [Enterococcus faecalis]|nr:hypothetical protein [Enterococcus faecalis]
ASCERASKHWCDRAGWRGEKAKQLRVGGTGCNSHPDFATGEYQPRTGQVCGTPAENAPERRVYSGCDNREAPRALSHVL